jgi:hypothetical protein
MEIASGSAVNPAAEIAAAAHARKTADTKDQTAAKLTAQALDPAKMTDRNARAAERRQEGRGRQLDIRA